MKISIVSFTDNGSKINADLVKKLEKDNDVKGYTISKCFPVQSFKGIPVSKRLYFEANFEIV